MSLICFEELLYVYCMLNADSEELQLEKAQELFQIYLC